MCRFFIYFSDIETNIKDQLWCHSHSIFKQSYKGVYTPGLDWTPRNVRIHLDGFGVGWYYEKYNTPSVYISTKTPWSDVNILNITKYIESKVIIAHIRSIKQSDIIPVIHEFNCHPFQYKESHV